jgi:hypothetical protein
MKVPRGGIIEQRYSSTLGGYNETGLNKVLLVLPLF